MTYDEKMAILKFVDRLERAKSEVSIPSANACMTNATLENLMDSYKRGQAAAFEMALNWAIVDLVPKE